MSEEQVKPQKSTKVMQIVIGIVFTLVLLLGLASGLAGGEEATDNASGGWDSNTTQQDSPF